MSTITLPVSDPILIVAIAMAGFLILPLITNKLRLPDIIGILIAGVLVGPHGLGLLERDDTIELLGKIGLLYLVFLAGLEVDLADLSRKKGRAISFGLLTFLVPQILGTLGGLLLFEFSLPTAILLGSVFSSHSFLALLIAKRLGLTEREISIAVIGGTVITDTLALLVLAGVAQSMTADFGPVFLIELLLMAGAFSALVVFGLPYVGRWFFKRVSDGGTHFIFMMAVLTICGFAAEHFAALEPIIGAFLAGLAMNRLVPHNGVLANRAFFVGNTIFVPFFLLSVGMLIDLKMVVSDARTIEMAIFMTFTVILCKGGAAWLMRTLFGYSRSEVVVAWGLSLPQAATTLAVVLVGHEELGLFDVSILNATIVMVLVTCVLGPILVQLAGRRVAAEIHDEVEEQGDDDHFQRILIPLANPENSENLLDLAIALRRPMSDEPLLPLSVAANEGAVANSERLLGSSVLHLAGAEAPVKPVIRVDPSPVTGILRAQAESRSTCLIIGWAGPENRWQRHFHLSRGIIDELLEESSNQLLVVRLSEPLAVVERMVLVLPTLAHAEPGFRELMSDWKLVAKRIGAVMTVVTEHPLSESLTERIRSTGSKCQLDFIHADVDLPQRVEALIDRQSMLVIIGCREGSISWDGTWSRMATRLAHQHEKVSLAIAYPRLGGQVPSAAIAKADNKQLILKQAAVYLQQEAAPIEELIKRGLPKEVQVEQALINQLRDGLSSLTPEVALVHASAPGPRWSRLAIVTLAQPLAYHDIEIGVLLVLINPLDTSADKHLEHLAALAKAIGQPERLQALLAAKTAADAKRALIEARRQER